MASSEERLATLEARLVSIESLMTRMDAKLDTLNGIYISRQEMAEMVRSRDERISNLKEEIESINQKLDEAESARKRAVPSWINVIIAFLALTIALYNGGGPLK